MEDTAHVNWIILDVSYTPKCHLCLKTTESRHTLKKSFDGVNNTYTV